MKCAVHQMWTLSATAATVAKRSVQCVRDPFATFIIVKIAWLERLVFPQLHRQPPLLTLLAPHRTYLALMFRPPVNPVPFHRMRVPPAALQSRSSWDSVLV